MESWERFIEGLTPEKLRELLLARGYIPGEDLVTTLWLALKMGKPLLLEGEPGCGKTELAKVLAEALETELIRLQCYEGIEASQALYDWDYPKQLLAIRMLERTSDPQSIEREIYSEKYLLKGPLLRAVLHEGPRPPVLLIDEIDRADEEFEAFLLEFLAEFQVTIPELGTFKAKTRPIVIITSNRTREIGDGLRRRCLYHYVTYPPKDREIEIIVAKVNGIEKKLAEQVVTAAGKLRSMKNIMKKPGVSETVDWANALKLLGYKELNEEAVERTLACVIKSGEDLRTVSPDDLVSNG
ncbi:MAG: MoxR family ATPase [Aeropyrum sp.]|nr:MoxR family ATPase [Aeropyrum sp.]